MQPLHDIRDGARMLRRNPGTSILAAVALALGIGSTTTMYSIVRGVLRDLPVDRPEQLMHIAVTDRTAGDHQYLRVPAADIVALRDQQRSFVAIAAYESRSVHLGDNDHRAQRVAIAAVSPSLFQVLRVAPLVGRALAPDDTRPGSTPVAVLGYTLWRNRYASDRAIVGRTIRIDGVPTSVVGVMREGFGFPQTEQMWTPLAIDTMHAAPGAKDGPAFTVIGRLRDGATRETAGADITALGRRLALADAVAHEGRALSVRPFYDEMVSHKARVIFRSMLLVVSFVLLIACANVANLLLARAVSRSREIAVRLALGASPGALVRQLLVESLAVAIPGGVLGLLLAWAGVTVFNSTLGFELAFWMRVQLDAGVLAFTTGLVVVAAVAAGLAPARQAARVAVGDVLKDRTRGSSSFRLGRASRALVVGEVALSCALLVVTGLMVKGVLTLTSRYVGAAPDHVATGRIELRRDAYPDVAARTRLFDALESRMAAVPGVTSVTLASHLPGNSVGSAPVEIGGVRYERPEDVPQSRVIAIAPTFFQTFGTPLLQGRPFAVGDRAGAPPVAIVNRAFAERFMASDPVGQRIRLTPNGKWTTIVGVAPVLGTVSGTGSRDSGLDAIYLPLAQSDWANVAIAARTTGDATALVATLRKIVGELDADVPLYQEGPLDVALSQATAGEKVFGGLFTFFGISALVLAVVGLVGVLAFAVGCRTSELGIRMALGGRPASILWLVLRGGLLQLAVGLAIGLVLAAIVAPQFGEALFTQEPHDPIVYASIALVLIVAGALAAIVPARRALAVSPMTALRAD